MELFLMDRNVQKLKYQIARILIDFGMEENASKQKGPTIIRHKMAIKTFLKYCNNLVESATIAFLQ